MLGQPVSMLIPRVVGFKLTGAIPAGATATDVVLTITEMLRKHGVVGKFVEFYGEGVAAVPLANRATIGNMSPEFGSTCAIFPIDDVTLDYLRLTGRSDDQVALVEAYAKEQGLWHDPATEPVFSEYLELDLSTVVPAHRRPEAPAGPDRAHRRQGGLPRGPADYVDDGTDNDVDEAGRSPSRRATRRPYREHHGAQAASDAPHPATLLPDADGRASRKVSVTMADGTQTELDHGHVAIASITSCTNTSNPSVMMAAALLAKNAVERGLTRQAVGQDLDGARLQGRHGLLREGRPRALPREARLPPGRLRLHDLHRQLRPAARGGLRGRPGERPRRRLGAVRQPQLRGPDQPRRQDELPGLPAAGHRLRPGRHDGLRLRRPSRSGSTSRQRRVPRGHLARRRRRGARGRGLDHQGHVHQRLRRRLRRRRALAVAAHPRGRHLRLGRRSRPTCASPRTSRACSVEPSPVSDITGARVLAKLGDSVTTDHISPAGSIKPDSPAGVYLADARRGPQGLQLLRLAPRQPRGDDPRHVRQHPAAQPAAGRRRGRLHPRLHRRRRADDDLRRRAALRRGRHPAGGPGRQGVRLGVLARLGGQGHPAARGQGRHRRDLRADPPLEPDRHGRPAAAVPGRARTPSRSGSTAPRRSTSPASRRSTTGPPRAR